MSNNVTRQPVGVIGLGDLGRRLATQIIANGTEILAFNRTARTLDFSLAVDPELITADIDHSKLILTELQSILQHCSVVHWAIASAELDVLPTVPRTCTVILHDSVMSNSLHALDKRPDSGQFVIAHCIMNDRKRVFVSKDRGDFATIMQHFQAIGLAPKETTTKEHDALMARTQGIFALLIELGLRKELDRGFSNGDLTPSAIELRSAVINREANWTPQTLQSILSNPHLAPFVREMFDLLQNSGKLSL